MAACGAAVVTRGQEKSLHQSIFQKWKPAHVLRSRDRDVVFAQLSKNIENACIKARKYRLAARVRSCLFEDPTIFWCGESR